MLRKRFEIIEKQEQALQHAYGQAKAAAPRTHYQAVMLYSQDYPVIEIGQITGCHRNSLRSGVARIVIKGWRDCKIIEVGRIGPD